MKIKRFEATEMRLALRQVREELGPDAIILASRRVGDRVEVTVAVEYEELTEAASANGRPNLVSANAGVFPDSASPATDNGPLSEELRTLRRMLETQVAQLAWNDLSRRSPLAMEVLRELAEMGFTQDIAARVVDRLPSDLDLAHARRLAIARLADEITVTGDRWLDYGGVLGLVGATGVGKSATVAKLAARWVLRHGAHSIALISTDALRFGAHQQLLRLGRLLGISAYVVDSIAQLPDLLGGLADRKLLLVDTAGMSQRDTRWPGMLAELNACQRMEIVLTLAANAQAGSIEETVARCAAARPVSCVLTKLDEATSLGGTLSSLIRTGLPASYLSDGQRIPEDLRPARSFDLVALAVSLAEYSGATVDEDTMSRRLGGNYVRT